MTAPITDDELRSVPKEQMLRVFPNMREDKFVERTIEEAQIEWCLQVIKAFVR